MSKGIINSLYETEKTAYCNALKNGQRSNYIKPWC